ncbi:hypothetical protein [Spirosoma pulveris]
MNTIIEAIDHPDWMLEEWRVKFLLSERMLHEVKKLAGIENWYEDPVITDIWRTRLGICYTSIFSFYTTFGILPQIGDRLFDEDTGLIIQNRSIDGQFKTITFTLNI